MSTEPLRIGIISFEHMHAFSYASALQHMAGVELAAVADSDAGRLERVRQEYPLITSFYADYVGMLEHTALDAVIICSANSQHREIAEECARRGKHILCEKPLALTVEDCRAMIDAARQAGVKLMTAFPVRFSPAVAEARRLVQEGHLGTVLGACTTNHGSMPGGWFVEKEKSGGGAVIDHTVHVADLLRWILQDEVETVYAEYATRLHDLQVEDVGQLIMHFRSGVIASLDTSWSRPRSYPIWGDVKMDFRGTDAQASINCFPTQVHRYDDQTGRHSAGNMGPDLDLLMIAEFLSAIREDREPMVTGEDGMEAVRVALAAYEAGEKAAPVRLR